MTRVGDICDSFLPLFFLQLSFREEALEVKVKLMQEVVRTIRSMRQDYLLHQFYLHF